jgi:DNA-binding transcriptional ArsR family regulator
MVRDSSAGEESPDLETILDALHDEDCRTIVSHLTEPMTADTIAERTDIPLSTTYRKLDVLTEAGLVAEGVELRSDGQHASQYMVAFDEVSIELTDAMALEVAVTTESQSADERLANLWSAVREET